MASLSEIKEASLTANSEVSSYTADVAGVLSKLDTGGSDAGQNTANNADNYFFKQGAYDFVGINEAGQADMSTAIDDYCAGVNRILEDIEATGKAEGRFVGEYAAEIDSFIVAIKLSCIATVNSLRKFQSDLATVVTTMKGKDTSVAENISTDAGTINSSIESEVAGNVTSGGANVASVGTNAAAGAMSTESI